MDKFEYGERVWYNGKQAVIREYGEENCLIQYLSMPIGRSCVPTESLSKEKNMQQGVGFIQVGDTTYPATAKLTTASTGEGMMYVSGGSFKDINPLEFGFGISTSIKPKQIIYSGFKTICIFDDDTKIMTQPSIEDLYDPEVGVAMCIMEKLYGSRSKFLKAVKDGYLQMSIDEVIQRQNTKIAKKKEKAKGK